MTEKEQERFEAELRRIGPAALPVDLMDRLRAAKAAAQPAIRIEPRKPSGLFEWFTGLRWAVAAAPVVVAAIVFFWLESRPAAGQGIKANAVQVDHALVSSFDAVAELPGGEPVRFRCRQWMDGVVMRDDAHGVVISQSSPRVEVVPVRIETY